MSQLTVRGSVGDRSGDTWATSPEEGSVRAGVGWGAAAPGPSDRVGAPWRRPGQGGPPCPHFTDPETEEQRQGGTRSLAEWPGQEMPLAPPEMASCGLMPPCGPGGLARSWWEPLLLLDAGPMPLRAHCLCPPVSRPVSFPGALRPRVSSRSPVAAPMGRAETGRRRDRRVAGQREAEAPSRLGVPHLHCGKCALSHGRAGLCRPGGARGAGAPGSRPSVGAVSR